MKRFLMVVLVTMFAVVSLAPSASAEWYSKRSYTSYRLPGGGWHSSSSYRSGHRLGSDFWTAAAVMTGVAIVSNLAFRPVYRQPATVYSEPPNYRGRVSYPSTRTRTVSIRNETSVCVEVLMTYGGGIYERTMSVGFLESGVVLEITAPVYDSRIYFRGRARTVRGEEDSIERWVYFSSYSRHSGRDEITFSPRDWRSPLETRVVAKVYPPPKPRSDKERISNKLDELDRRLGE